MLPMSIRGTHAYIQVAQIEFTALYLSTNTMAIESRVLPICSTGPASLHVRLVSRCCHLLPVIVNDAPIELTREIETEPIAFVSPENGNGIFRSKAPPAA